MTIQLTKAQKDIFKSVTGQKPKNFDQTASAKTLAYLLETAEMTVVSELTLEELRQHGFAHIAELLQDLENALCIHDLAKTA